MNAIAENHALLTRRQFFGRSATGIGAAALASLLRPEALAAAAQPSGLPHFPAKAKRVIFLFQAGAPSHLDLFDYKPELEKWDAKEVPAEVVGSGKLTTNTKPGNRPVIPPLAKFARRGRSGAWVSDLLPHTASVADELCFIKSLVTEPVAHQPAVTFLLTGSEIPGRPSMGAWRTYGLGSASHDLPSFVVMTSRDEVGNCGVLLNDYYWGSGFLPSVHQGVCLRGNGSPVLNLSNPEGMSRPMRRGMLDDLARLNQMQLRETHDPEIATRIAQYEMAYQMQVSVPELTDLSNEPASVLEMYGPDVRRRGSYAYNCIMARRLAERGVGFVQVMHSGWDHHDRIVSGLDRLCQNTDQPSAALIKDLKQRGLLDDTLVIWGGEFGRTPFSQGKIQSRAQMGRDHHPYAFTMWMAGGGVKPGISYGASDEFGYNVVENRVHIHDFQATVLHLLGIDHERLTFKFQGRHFRLTDVSGQVVRSVLI